MTRSKVLRILSKALAQVVRGVRFANLVMICASLALSPAASAIEVEISSYRQLKVFNSQRGEQESTVTLAPGSVLEIPDQYRKVRNGKVDFELTLQNWLETAARQGTDRADGKNLGFYDHRDEKGRRTQDYFFPVKVKKAGEGSRNVEALKNQNTFFMALSSIARSGDGLIVNPSASAIAESAPQSRPPPAAPAAKPPAARPAPQAQTPPSPPARPAPQPPPAQRKPLEATAGCGPGQPCAEAQQNKVLAEFLRDIREINSHVRQEGERRRENMGDVVANVEGAFEQTCGLSMSAYIPEVMRQAQAQGVPPETLLAMLSKESMGNCFATRLEGRDSSGRAQYSRGLFQIHANSARVRGCTALERRDIQRAGSIAGLRRAPQCLENPVVNLSEAINVLKRKIAIFTSPMTVRNVEYKRPGRAWDSKAVEVAEFDASKLKDSQGRWKRDLWIMAASGYNGGEAWVFRAKSDVERFNQRHGARLDPNNWATLRAFYFRRDLEENAQVRYFGEEHVGRSTENAVLNVIYAENMVMSDRKNGKSTLADEWFTRIAAVRGTSRGNVAAR